MHMNGRWIHGVHVVETIQHGVYGVIGKHVVYQYVEEEPKVEQEHVQITRMQVKVEL